MIIITHRGLDLAYTKYFKESSLEAFTDQLNRGYGLEFDIRLTSDNVPVIIHDANLKRISDGADERAINEISSAEILAMEFDGCHITTFANLINLIEIKQAQGMISAIHLKNAAQDQATLDIVLEHFKNADPGKYLLFDVKIETARYLKSKNPKLMLAPSVAHSYDIHHYSEVVGNTLLSVDEVIANKDLFDWVWLDEWDTADENGGIKTFYNSKTFGIIREHGFKIALVTPELHALSPGLLGGEAHTDAQSHESLIKRIQEILKLLPDAVCTDFPDEVKKNSLQ